jgi:uncharacterized membrane protein YdbT with pleckstrin-like domain
MSYIEEHLMAGEQIVHRTYVHWSVFLLPILPLIAAIWLFSVGGDTAIGLGVFILIVGVTSTGIFAVIQRQTSEFVVTNKRVLIKTGLGRRQSLETLLSKIESIAVEQSVVGRILDFGTIVVIGTGGSKEPFHRIAYPMQFRRKVQEQIAELAKERSLTPPPAAPLSTSATDLDQQLRSLAKLRDDGLITEADFEAKKKKMLGI